MEKSEVRQMLKETISIIVIALALALLLRNFVIEGRIIPSGSMLPTLQLQDRVMVNKFIYDFKDPVRGDIIILDPPPALERTDLFIKRVIGLPGETVEMKNGKVYINENALKEPYLAEPLDYTFGPVVVPQNSLLVLGDNRNSSFDSHKWVPAWLTRDRVKGKAFMVYWPLNHLHLLGREVSFE
ncbi:MAG TPA: signal peptidase I [Syntrophomonadaceae bacterium]|nr:signal peptidase I [Syntrophomonadaceae bacterium]